LFLLGIIIYIPERLEGIFAPKMPITHPTTTTTSSNILEYTFVAANALRDVAAATQIPFVGTVCALASTIIPTVQVCNFPSNLHSVLN
jgi:hypothetical protein